MFVKTNNKNRWINLSTCRSVETRQVNPSQPWHIVLSSAVILSDTERQFVGRFETEAEAEEAINAMWQAYSDGEKIWEVEAFNTISPDERWTVERFNTLVSESEHRELYESRNQIEKLCEFGTDLMNLVERKQWQLTHKFNESYFALYFGSRPIFGVRLKGFQALYVKLPADLLAEHNNEQYTYTYRTSYKSGVYPRDVKVENIKEVLKFAYRWHAGLLV